MDILPFEVAKMTNYLPTSIGHFFLYKVLYPLSTHSHTSTIFWFPKPQVNSPPATGFPSHLKGSAAAAACSAPRVR